LTDDAATTKRVLDTVTQGNEFLKGRLLVVAFEGWNDAGEAATGAVQLLREQLDVVTIAGVDAEEYFDFQFNRPMVSQDDEGNRALIWPSATIYGPASTEVDNIPLAADAELRVGSDNTGNVFLLVGAEPSRNWKKFTVEVLDAAMTAGVSGIVLLGAMLADVPHTRPISVTATSDNASVRAQLGIERPTYEGPVGILGVIADAAEALGVPTVSIWASVPHYVHNAPSPKATLALIDKLEELVDVVIPRGDLVDEASAWESGIDALAGEDDEMASYIEQLEQARDTVDSPEASGEAIAQEFEKYLRKRGDGRPDEPWRSTN
jgi:predicted ATP-grasp superfamily ATP-dependent carboligase